MYCSKCGKQIDEDSKFCPFCGNTVMVSSTQKVPDERKKVQVGTNKPQIPVMIVTGGVVAVLVLVISCVFLFKSLDNKDAGSKEEVKANDASDSEGVITENYTLDGLLDLSEEDLLEGQRKSESLDTDLSIIVDNPLDTEVEIEDVEEDVPGEAVFTSTTGVSILSDAKLFKEQIRAKNKEELMNIINSEELTDEEKQAAVDAMVQMTAIAEKEAAAEIFLEAKGFDVVVSINGDTVDVVVNAAALDDIMRAQIEDIVKRKTEISAENIVISTVVK